MTLSANTATAAGTDISANGGARTHRLPLATLALAACVYMLLDGLGFDGIWMAALKIVPIAILAAQAHRHLQGRTCALALAALVFSATGDVLLAMDFPNQFVLGLGAFLLAQLIYTGTFLRAARRPDLRVVLRGLAVVVAAALLARQVLPAAGALATPVLLYIIAIVGMALAAASHRSGSSLLFAGALTFMMSDALIAINRFVDPVPMAGTWIMLTYYGAQALLVYGLIRADLAAQRA